MDVGTLMGSGSKWSRITVILKKNFSVIAILLHSTSLKNVKHPFFSNDLENNLWNLCNLWEIRISDTSAFIGDKGIKGLSSSSWILEPVGGTALDSEGAGYGGDDSDEELENLDDGIPIDFNHNTLSLKI